jgi:hypothetical protein
VTRATLSANLRVMMKGLDDDSWLSGVARTMPHQ